MQYYLCYIFIIYNSDTHFPFLCLVSLKPLHTNINSHNTPKIPFKPVDLAVDKIAVKCSALLPTDEI